MGFTPFTILSLGLFLLCAATCHAVARRRGANPVPWGVAGFVFGPLAVPFVFLAAGGRHSIET